MLDLYENPKKPEHRRNNDAFRILVETYGRLTFSRPSPVAPWYWQVVVLGEGPYPVLINIWPTSATGQRDGYKSVRGWDRIERLIEQAILENGYGDEDDAFEIIDEGDHA